MSGQQIIKSVVWTLNSKRINMLIFNIIEQNATQIR